MKIVLPLCFLAASAAALAQTATTTARPPRYIDPAPYDFDEHAGWEPMFDGRTLAGWEGPTEAWRVEDGAIVSSGTGPGVPVYLLWKGRDGGDLKDFEFKTEIRLEGERANSGVQFRAQMLGRTDKPGSEWESFGYQADFDWPNVQTGALIECCAGPRRGPAPRPFRASMGQALRVVAPERSAPVLLGTIGDAEVLKARINVGGWNRLHVIAEGRTLQCYINGMLVSVVVDQDPARFLSHGRLAIQLEGAGDRKVSYRNMWLKRL